MYKTNQSPQNNSYSSYKSPSHESLSKFSINTKQGQ